MSLNNPIYLNEGCVLNSDGLETLRNIDLSRT